MGEQVGNRALMMFLSIILLLSNACVGTRKSIKIRISSHECLNLTDDAKSLPVLLKVYELSNEAEFMQASFENLWKRDEKTLGNSFQSRHEYTIYPDKVERFSFNKKEETQYIGFFATFRKPSREVWKKIVKVPPGIVPKTINVSLQNNELK
jgi:type VI secretion system protein VasD